MAAYNVVSSFINRVNGVGASVSGSAARAYESASAVATYIAQAMPEALSKTSSPTTMQLTKELHERVQNLESRTKGLEKAVYDGDLELNERRNLHNADVFTLCNKYRTLFGLTIGKKNVYHISLRVNSNSKRGESH